MFGIGIFIEMESGFMVVRGWGRRMGSVFMEIGFFCRVMECFSMR